MPMRGSVAPLARTTCCKNELPSSCMWGPPAKSRVGSRKVHPLATEVTLRAGSVKPSGPMAIMPYSVPVGASW